jgi:nicotinic acid mononucleotide adenylyltransferase
LFFSLNFLFANGARSTGPVLEKLEKQLSDLDKYDKVAFYLGSFNPLHKGHDSVIKGLLSSGFRFVVIMPSFFKGSKVRIPVALRTEMLLSYAKSIPNLIVFEMPLTEQEEKDPGSLKVFSENLIDFFDFVHSKKAFVFHVLGSDVIPKKIEELRANQKRKPYDGFVIAKRKGYEENLNYISEIESLGYKVETFNPALEGEISSSKVRQKIAASEDISLEMPLAILKFIKENKLYGASI